jgi:hypothetical protein
MNLDILTNDNEYTPWLIITKLIPSQEIDEIKNILGPKLIGEIEDLYNECNLLKEIHSDYREETERVLNKKQSESNDFNKLIYGSSFQISILKDKIKYLINNLIQVQQSNLKDNKLPESTNNIVNYILQENEIQEQGNYIEKLKDKIIPSPENIEESDSNQKINFLSIYPIVNELRVHLKKEKNYLLKKIDLYHNLLDNEKLYREKIEDFSNQELPSLKAFQEASKELFENFQKEKEEYNINLIFNKSEEITKKREAMLTAKPDDLKLNTKSKPLEDQYIITNDENNRIDINRDKSITKIHKNKNIKNKVKDKDNVNKKIKHKKSHKHKSMVNSESQLIRTESLMNIDNQNALKNKHSKSEIISGIPSSPTLHRSPSKECLPNSSPSHIPLKLPLTSLVPSINLPFTKTPSIPNNKVILNPIIPHPPLKPIKNDKIYSRKRYNAVSNSTSIVTSSKLV